MVSAITPGCLVQHPNREDWGMGQVQSVIGTRITVNFENAGKRVINAEQVELILVNPNPRDFED